MLKLLARQIHRDRERLAAVKLLVPARALATGLLDHPATEGQDEPRLFRQRNERERRNAPAPRMIPTHEGFDAGDVPRLELHDRLIAEHEFSALESRPK